MVTRFFIKALIFAGLVLLAFLLPILIIVGSGEVDSPKDIARQQAKADRQIIFGNAYSETSKLLKLESVLLRKPEVLALGSSRILEIRSEFFRPGVRFYNAGLAARKLLQFRQFLDLIPPSAQPKVLIVCLDQRYFDPKDLYSQNDFEDELSRARDPWRPFNIFAENWRTAYLDFFAGKFDLEDVFRSSEDGLTLVGLQARTDRLGARNDGSQFYGEKMHRLMKNPEAPRFNEAFSYLKSGEQRFRFGQEVLPDSLTEIGSFLAECRSRGIQVVGFVPPYAGQVYDKLKEGGKHDYVFQIGGKVVPLFREYGFVCLDLTDVRAIGASDAEFLDGYHPTEKATLRMFIEMVKAAPALQPYCDLDELRALLKNSTNDFYVIQN